MRESNRDVTEGELLRLLIENVRDCAIFVVDPDGRVCNWNPGAERLFGYREDEIVGRSAAVFFTPEDVAAGVPQRDLQRARETGRCEGDRWYVRKDGSRFRSGAVTVPLWNEARALRGFATTVRDRTGDRHRASAGQPAAILEATLDAVITIDHEGRVTEFNPAAERLFGYTKAGALGRDLSELVVPPRLCEAHRRGMAHYLATGEGPVIGRRTEMPALRADGTEFPVELAITRLSGDGPPAFTASLRDVSERTRAEIRRGARLALTQVLAQAGSVPEAAAGVLRAVCESLEWDVGLFWVPDHGAGVLRCLGCWHSPAAPAPEFEAVSRARTFGPGEGLPGRVWTAGKPAWILDVARDSNFPRAAVADRDGLHGAFACPLVADGAVHGIIEFFSRRAREPDADLLEMMATAADQIGQFVVRRRAEDAHRESEQRFARFMQHLPGLAWIKDGQGRYVYANDAAETAFGTPRERLYGRTDEEVFPPATAAQFRENDRRALERGEVQAFEALEHPDGTTRHSLVSKFPIPSSDDRPAFVGGIAIDVTDLRRAEEVRQFLAEAGAVLSSTLDYEATLSAVARLSVPRLADWCSVYLVDTGGGLRRIAVAHADPEKVRWAEEIARRYPPEPTDPRGVGGVIRSGEPLLVPDLTDDLLVAGARDPDHLVLLRELGLRSVMIVPLVARDRTLGAVTFVAAGSGRRYGTGDLALAQELARRAALAVDNARLFRESEESLRRLGLLVDASARLTSSLELGAVQTAILDLSHRLVAADAHAVWRLDAAAGEWFIADSANLSESYLRDDGRIASGGHAIPDRPIVAEDAQGSTVLESRRLAYRAEGIESVLAVPLRVHGAVAGTLVFYYRTRHKFDDVTVRVASALADLAGAALGTAELYQRESALRRRAEEADKAKDEFLALLGHELRNPIAPIKNALHILDLKGHDPATVARARAMIDRQTTHLTRLVDELLDASRITRGKVRLTVERLDLAALVRTVVEDHRAGVENAGLTLEVDAPPRPTRVRGDAARLTQIVTNLLANAAKFTPSGGRVTVRLDVEGGEAVLRAADTGIGIDGNDLPTLFRPFHQVNADPARTKGGLGLGLAVVKGLVELHGGRVGAASAGLGAGATFTVRLPLDDTAPVPPPAAAEVGTAVGSGLRVVIVEDGADTAESLAEVLELKGFAVSIATTGPDGLALCRREPPNAVVCDIGLPGMTGFEVARALRADPATAGAVLVAVSGYGQDEDRRKAHEAGFDALLAKPADTDELARLLIRPGNSSRV